MKWNTIMKKERLSKIIIKLQIVIFIKNIYIFIKNLNIQKV